MSFFWNDDDLPWGKRTFSKRDAKALKTLSKRMGKAMMKAKLLDVDKIFGIKRKSATKK